MKKVIVILILSVLTTPVMAQSAPSSQDQQLNADWQALATALAHVGRSFGDAMKARDEEIAALKKQLTAKDTDKKAEPEKQK